MSPQQHRTTIRVGGYAPRQSVHSRAVDRFADVVRTRSNGEIEVEIVYNIMDDGRPATDLFELVRSGELTWCYYSTSYLGAAVPELDALEVPFLFGTVDRAHVALDGELGSALAAAVRDRADFEVLGFWDNGLRHLTNSVRPIEGPDDCRGLRIRLQPNRIHEALARSWGMEPVPAELSEGIAMIERGDVDAQENPLANTVAYGVDHAHITLTGHLYGARGLFANPSAMDHLGPAADLVREAAAEAIAFQRGAAADYEDELRQRLAAEGRQIVDPTSDQRAVFAQAAAGVIDDALAAVDPAVLGLLPSGNPEQNRTLKETR